MSQARAGLVIDASVSLAWFFDDEATDFTERILDRITAEPAWVPALWVLECANVLAGAERRGRIDATQRRTLIERAMALPLMIDREPVTMAEIDWLASQYGLTAYDAAYLELAIRRSLTLVTLDGKLLAAARQAGQPVQTGPSR